ncbi:hypothetical protein SLEP1_g43560 [Rubroshorea leprosula]|uniref:Uncharacterized protein n=1 Tax=Rubroshorea leprosula TaxID=152421 RepID=A0AAV5LEB8_9ROSI|nr:hypothetical protein SLEP1_g43560 [Rubroshorea leprosula]
MAQCRILDWGRGLAMPFFFLLFGFCRMGSSWWSG